MDHGYIDVEFSWENECNEMYNKIHIVEIDDVYIRWIPTILCIYVCNGAYFICLCADVYIH